MSIVGNTEISYWLNLNTVLALNADTYLQIHIIITVSYSNLNPILFKFRDARLHGPVHKVWIFFIASSRSECSDEPVNTWVQVQNFQNPELLKFKF